MVHSLERRVNSNGYGTIVVSFVSNVILYSIKFQGINIGNSTPKKDFHG